DRWRRCDPSCVREGEGPRSCHGGAQGDHLLKLQRHERMWIIRRQFAAAAALALACTTAGQVPESGTPASDVFYQPMEGETHFANIRQLTFGGNNAEAYFSTDGTRLIFQRQDSVEAGCDQQFVMNIDGSGVHRVSNGLGRTTCGYFIEGDNRIIYSSSFAHDSACPAPVDRSEGYVWPLNHLELYTANPDGSDIRQLTSNGTYNAEA